MSYACGRAASRIGEASVDRSATAFASSSLNRATSAANGASDSARTLGMTGSRTIRTREWAARARATKRRTLSAVCSAFV